MSKNLTKDSYSLFKETFRLLNINQRKFQYRLTTKNFSQIELKLLNAFLLYRKNDIGQSMDLLLSFKSSNHFYEGTRLYLKGLIQNHLSKFKLAIGNFKRSLELYDRCRDDFAVSPLIMLSLCYCNRMDIKEMFLYLKKLRKCKGDGSSYVIFSKIQLESEYLVLTGKNEAASVLLHKALKSKDSQLENYRPSFLLTLFNIHLKSNNHIKCTDILKKYKRCSGGHTVRANYSYMKILLDNLTNDQTIYVYDEKFEEYPELLWQLHVIKELSIGNTVDAAIYWDMLATHNPDLYRDGFQFTGELCLFASCLVKHQITASTDIDLEVLASIKINSAKLLYILQNNNGPINKYVLIKLLWQLEYSDLVGARLRNTIYQCKKKFNCEIKSVQENYFLVKDEQEQKVS